LLILIITFLLLWLFTIKMKWANFWARLSADKVGYYCNRSSEIVGILTAFFVAYILHVLRSATRGLRGGQNSYPPPPRENNWTRPHPVPVKNVESNSVLVPAPSHSTSSPPRTRIFQLHHRSVPVIMNLFY